MEQSSLTPIDAAAVLVVLAAVFGYVNHRLFKLPHTIGLTIMGALASLAVVAADALIPGFAPGQAVRGFLQGIDFETALMEGMLSFLLFAGALHVDLAVLLRSKWPVLAMATAGTMISTVVVGLGFKGVTLALGFVSLIVAELLLAKASGYVLVMAGVAVWGVHLGLTQGLLSAMVADSAPDHLRGTAFGIFNLVNGIALLFASLAAGLLWQMLGASVAFYAGAAFAGAALLLLLVSFRSRHWA